MNLGQIFRWPLAIGLLTLIGLISGLVSDGWGDALAALGLFAPAAVVAWFCLLRREPKGDSVDAPATRLARPPT